MARKYGEDINSRRSVAKLQRRWNEAIGSRKPTKEEAHAILKKVWYPGHPSLQNYEETSQGGESDQGFYKPEHQILTHKIYRDRPIDSAPKPFGRV